VVRLSGWGGAGSRVVGRDGAAWRGAGGKHAVGGIGSARAARTVRPVAARYGRAVGGARRRYTPHTTRQEKGAAISRVLRALISRVETPRDDLCRGCPVEPDPRCSSKKLTRIAGRPGIRPRCSETLIRSQAATYIVIGTEQYSVRNGDQWAPS